MQTPYKHQLEGLQLLRTNPRYALFWECGVGKTLPVIMTADKHFRDNKIDLWIIVCPKAAMYNWVAEIEENSESIQAGMILDGKPKERRRELVRAQNEDKGVLITNYDKLRLHEDELLEVMRLRRVMLTFDESHYAKNAQAKRTKIAIMMADRAAYVTLLTGTPIGRDILDIFSQYRILDHGATFGESRWNFMRRYLIQSSHVPGKWVPKRGAAEEIREKMWLLADLKTKAECLDLPDTRWTTYSVGMPAKTTELYNRLAQEFIATYHREETGKLDRVTAANAAVALMKLQQVTSGFFLRPDKQIIELEDQPKLEAVAEIVGQYSPTDKVVVWARFIRDIQRTLEFLEEFQPLSIEAKHSAQERMDITRVFNANNAHRVLVSNPACGGSAINLTGGSVNIYFSNSFDYIHRMQSRDRTHRIGQERKVTYIDLVVPGTVDETILAALSDKRNLVDYLQDIPVQEMVLPGGNDFERGDKGDADTVHRGGRQAYTGRSRSDGSKDGFRGFGKAVRLPFGPEGPAESSREDAERTSGTDEGVNDTPTVVAWW